MKDDYLELADWRRRVAEMYARWRHESEADPEAATLRLRRERDDMFRTHPQSPLPAEARADFAGLPYWDYNPDYRMRAVVELDEAPMVAMPLGLPPVVLPVSGEERFSFRRIGVVRLLGPLIGAELPVFWMEGYAGGLFLPFQDATSGRETYGAGRYLLDTVKGADFGGDPSRNELLLDFNLAYHPSCVYDPRWNCPLAPPDSRVTLEVRVGERLA